MTFIAESMTNAIHVEIKEHLSKNPLKTSSGFDPLKQAQLASFNGWFLWDKKMQHAELKRVGYKFDF